MKKKTMAICLCVALVAIALVGSTLAYFTDTDKATNTFTTAKVDIELIEQERGENGLQDFTPNKKLYPIVGSAQGPKDEYGLPTAKNYVDKIVTVKNLEEDAYVRVYFAIPAALVGDTESNNVLHFNEGNKFTADGNYADEGKPNSDQHQSDDYVTFMKDKVRLEGVTNIDGIDYVVYYMTYNKVLKANETTGSAFLVGVYLDKRVDYDGTYYTMDGEKIEFDFTNGVNIPVFAVGVQAEGFDNADAAIEAAFGKNYNPF